MYCKHCGEALNDYQAICIKCGVEVGKGSSFCENCGKAVAPKAVYCMGCGIALNKNQSLKQKNKSDEPDVEIDVEGIKKRSIVTSIILSIITCGIYEYFWIATLTNDTNKALGKKNEMSGFVVALLTLVTFGLFGIYWAYKMGNNVDMLSGKKRRSTRWIFLGITAGLAYLGFGLIGLFVVYAMTQTALNKAIDEANE